MEDIDKKAWAVQNRIIAVTVAMMQGEGLAEEEKELIQKEKADEKRCKTRAKGCTQRTP